MSDDVMVLIRGLYTYTSGSYKRLADFQNYQIDHNGGIHKILQMSGTIWLELYYCIERILNYRESLIAYFEKKYENFIHSLGKKEATGNTNVEKLIKILKDVNIWPFLYFNKHLLNHFNPFNGYCQSNFTKIHLIIQRADSFIIKIAKYFIKDELLSKIFEIDVIKDAKDIFVETDCENFLKNNCNIFSEEKVEELGGVLCQRNNRN